jgi:hypothetical protein
MGGIMPLERTQETSLEENNTRGYFCLQVKEVAEANGYRLSALVEASGLPQETLEKIWEHPTQDVDLATMVVLAVVLQVKLDAIVKIGK